jgi:hypothetical protein
MAIEALVSSAIAILTPYVAAGAQKAAEVAGQAIATGAGTLLQRVREWFASDDEAASALSKFEEKPSRYAPSVEDILLEKATANPPIATDLQALIEGMGPRIEVFQKIKTLAGQAVGLDIAKWERGAASAFQDVDLVERGATLTGAKVGY